MKKEKEIKVLYIEPLKAPKVMTIKNELETFQKMVDGYIECLNIADDAVIICNEEGKLKGMMHNRAVRTDAGELYDTISGAFIIAGDDFESGEFTSLSEENLKSYADRFHYPEVLMKREGKTVVQPINEELAYFIAEEMKATGDFAL